VLTKVLRKLGKTNLDDVRALLLIAVASSIQTSRPASVPQQQLQHTNGRAPCSINEMLLTAEWTVRYTDRGQSRLQWRQVGHKKTIDRDCIFPRSAADGGCGRRRTMLVTVGATKWSGPGQMRSGSRALPPKHISRLRAGRGRYFFPLNASFNVPALLVLGCMPITFFVSMQKNDLAPVEKKNNNTKINVWRAREGSARAYVTMASSMQIPYTVAVLVKY